MRRFDLPTTNSTRLADALPLRCLMTDAATGEWLDFGVPLAQVQARRLDEVQPALRQAQALVEQHGWWAAGFLCYEAAPAFDAALVVREREAGDELPLVWFGLFEAPERVKDKSKAESKPESTPQRRERTRR